MFSGGSLTYYLGVSSKHMHPLGAASGDVCWMPMATNTDTMIIYVLDSADTNRHERIVKKVNARVSQTSNHRNWAWEIKSILENVICSPGGTNAPVMASHTERQSTW